MPEHIEGPLLIVKEILQIPNVELALALLVALALAVAVIRLSSRN